MLNLKKGFLLFVLPMALAVPAFAGMHMLFAAGIAFLSALWWFAVIYGDARHRHLPHPALLGLLGLLLNVYGGILYLYLLHNDSPDELDSALWRLLTLRSPTVPSPRQASAHLAITSDPPSGA